MTGYQRLRFFQNIRMLAAANDFMIKYGRYNKLIENMVLHCEKTDYKKGLFMLAHTLFSGIRKSHGVLVEEQQFQKEGGKQLYAALTDPRVNVKECADQLRATFQKWLEIGFIIERKDFREEWADHEYNLKKLSALIFWQERHKLSTPQLVHRKCCSIPQEYFIKLMDLLGKVLGMESLEYRDLKRIQEKSANPELAPEDEIYFGCDSVINAFERAWKKFVDQAEALNGGFAKKEILAPQVRYNKIGFEFFGQIVKLTKDSKTELLSAADEQHNAKWDQLLETETILHWNFNDRYPEFKPDDVIQVAHGGGYFHIMSFLFGKSIGYSPDREEGPAPCLYVAPPNYGGCGLRFYAQRESPVNFDIPCIFTAKTKVNALRHSVRHPDEALLTKEKVEELSDIRIEILPGFSH